MAKYFFFAAFFVKIPFVLLIVSLSKSSGRAPDLAPSSLEAAVQRLADDALGVKQMQDAYTAATSHQPKFDDGYSAVTTLSSRLSKQLEEREDALKRLYSKAVEAYKTNQGTTTSLEKCCNVNPETVSFDARFNTTINTLKACDRLTATNTLPATSITPALLATFVDNFKRIPELKWQYYASEEGYSTFYPTFHFADAPKTCGTYDPRFRPWYVAAAVPEPKNVVIVLDTSGSMVEKVSGTSHTRLFLAKQAVHAVLDTLSPTDKVAVIGFATVTQTPLGCFGQRLGVGTPVNIKALKNFVATLQPEGHTNYAPALSKAFELLHATAQSQSMEDNNGIQRKRDNVIIFLSDGAPTDVADSLVFSALDHGNAKIGYSAVILTYAAGNIDSSGITILRNMAEQTYTPTGRGSENIQKGDFKIISDFTTIRQALARYYSFFSKSSAAPIVYSKPYYDGLGLGLVITIASPVRHDNKLKGVVAVDITVDDVLSLVTYFTTGDHQYAFLIDSLGHAVLHPMLPDPLEVNADPIFQNVQLLEPDPEFKSVYDSMLRRESGNSTYLATRFIRRGNSKFQGTQSVQVMSSYFWEPVDGTDYVVCVVILTEEINHLPTVSQQRSSSGESIYHRFDLIPPKAHTCSQFGHLALRGHTSLKFAPDAFISPSYYLNVPETNKTVQAYLNYLDDVTETVDNIYFKPTVRNDVRLTARCDDLWTSSKAREYQSSLVWTYIATTDGVFRLIPGSQLEIGWHAFNRGWYLRARSSPGKLTFSTPYVDGFGAGHVITMAHTIMIRYKESKSVAAVMALDFTMGYLWQQLVTIYKECAGTLSRCFVMDEQGYLVVHPDYLIPNTNPVWVHLAAKEPSIAANLIREKILLQRTCAKYESRQVFFSYEMSQNVTIYKTSDNCAKIYLINNTNIYLGVISASPSCSSTTARCASCAPNDLGECSASSQNFDCTCPCWTTLGYQPCTNSFDPASRIHDVCPPEEFFIPVPIRQRDPTKNLKPCFDGKCYNLTSLLDCGATVGCDWCVLNRLKFELKVPYCGTDCTCFGGIEGQTNPKRDCQAVLPSSVPVSEPTTSQSQTNPVNTSTGTTAGIAAGLSGVIVLCAILGFAFQKQKACKERRRISSSSSATIMTNPDKPCHEAVEAQKEIPECVEYYKAENCAEVKHNVSAAMYMYTSVMQMPASREQHSPCSTDASGQARRLSHDKVADEELSAPSRASLDHHSEVTKEEIVMV